MEYLIVGAFGVFGVLSRFGLDRALGNSIEPFPKSTLLINIAGSFLAGCLYVLAERRNLSPLLQLGLLVGFCGGFTTFSAYTLQTVQMIERNRLFPALAYLILSPVLGLAAATLPIFIFQKIGA